MGCVWHAAMKGGVEAQSAWSNSKEIYIKSVQHYKTATTTVSLMKHSDYF